MVIKGTKGLRSIQTSTTNPASRPLLCPKCKEQSRKVSDGKGGFIYQCGICQTKFSFLAISD